ncbi:MAG: SMI1/KNR4 family protein [Myxococcota bacterium]
MRFRIRALKTTEADVFGASAHEFVLAPPLAEHEVAGAEAQWGISFPEDYRAFLLEAGAGGAGPYYGLFPLRRIGGRWVWEGDGGDMVSAPEKPWRHDEKWNLDGHPIRDAEPTEEDPRFDYESFEEAWEEWNEKFETIYWDPKWTEGAICLCHEGCALRNWLVVTGSRRGEIWWDGTADGRGLSPRTTADGKPMHFRAWYLEWLDRCERPHRGEDVCC